METPLPPLTEQPSQARNKLAIASGALGLGGVVITLIGLIISLVFSPMLPYFAICCGLSILLAIVGLVLGIIALTQIKHNPGQKGKGLAITGVVLGGIGVVLLCLSPVIVIAVLTIMGPVIGNVFSTINSSLTVP